MLAKMKKPRMKKETKIENEKVFCAY